MFTLFVRSVNASFLCSEKFGALASRCITMLVCSVMYSVQGDVWCLGSPRFRVVGSFSSGCFMRRREIVFIIQLRFHVAGSCSGGFFL